MVETALFVLGHAAAGLFYAAHYHPALTSAACVAAFLLTLKFAP